MYGDSEVYQPATGIDLNNSCLCEKHVQRGYEGTFKGTSVPTPVPAFRVENELPVTVDMFRHDTSDGRSLLSLLYAGPPTRKPSALKKSCDGEEGKRGGDRTSIPLFCACARCGWGVSASHLCVPGRALEQDEVIKAGCPRVIAVSLLCKLHTIRLHCFTFLTPPLPLIWYCS